MSKSLIKPLGDTLKKDCFIPIENLNNILKMPTIQNY